MCHHIPVVQELLAAIEAVPAEDWVLVLLGILVPIPMAYFPHARQAYYQWRLDRRLARNPEIYQAELHDYEYKIGEDLDEVDWRKVLWSGIVNGLLVTGYIVLLKIESTWAFNLTVAAGAILFGIALWQHSKSISTRADEPYSAMITDASPEIIWGIFGSIFFAMAIVFFAMQIF